MLERVFRLQDNATTVRTEVLGGLTTFMTMAYIVFVNPAVLSQTGMDFEAVMAATCLSAGIATWVMGLAANYPIALAPGMGENFFFLTAVLGMGVSWQVALAAVFVSGVVFFLLTFLRIREMIIDAVPQSLKHAIAVGIGLFIALIGLTGAGVIEPSQGPGLVKLGDLGRTPVILALAVLTLTVAFMANRIRGAILIGILAGAAAAWSLDLVEWQGLVAAPPSLAPTFLQLDLAGLLDVALIPVVVIFLFMAVFDAIGTLIGIMLSVVVLNIGDGGREKQMENEARRLTAVIKLARDEAVLMSQELSMVIKDNHYDFQVLGEKKWQPLVDEQILSRHGLQDGLGLALEMEAFDFTPKRNKTKGQGSTGAKDADVDARLYFLSSGEVQPFTLYIKQQDAVDGTRFKVIVDEEGEVSWQGPLHDAER